MKYLLNLCLLISVTAHAALPAPHYRPRTIHRQLSVALWPGRPSSAPTGRLHRSLDARGARPLLCAQPMIAVADVVAASTWFQNSLGLFSAHGGDEYEMLMAGDHEHLHLGDPTDPSRGNGVML